jgi:excisionase family DNA binding protein
LTVDEAAQLLHVQPETIRRRIRTKELRGGPDGGVRLVPLDDWLRVEDAAALLSVAPATVRANIKRGRLVGRREGHGRWRVRLASVLEDRRVDARAAGLFGAEPAGDVDDAPRPSRRRGRASREVFVRLYDEEPELLERCVDRHGSIRVAVVEGLRAIDDDQIDVDVAELRAAHDLRGEQLERVRTAHRNLSAHAASRLVDEVYCPRCEAMIPIGELEEHQLEDGTTALHCGRHRYRKPRVATRAPVELADVE